MKKRELIGIIILILGVAITTLGFLGSAQDLFRLNGLHKMEIKTKDIFDKGAIAQDSLTTIAIQKSETMQELVGSFIILVIGIMFVFIGVGLRRASGKVQ